LRIDTEGSSGDSVATYFLHFGVDHFPEVKFRVLFLDEALKLLVGDFIAFFIFAVLGEVFLNCIVGEMD